MKGFKDSTKMQPGHSFTHPSGWFDGVPALAGGGTIGGTTHQGSEASRLHGNAEVQRSLPTTEELQEAGGHDPLRAGFKKGGEVHKHFHVHKHDGKKTKSKSYKSVEKKAEKYAEGGHVYNQTTVDKAEGAGFGDYAKGGKVHIKAKNRGSLHRDMGVPQGKKIPRGAIRSKLAHDKAEHNVKGVKKDVFALNFGKGKKNAGGAVYATGGTVNRLAIGGAPIGAQPRPMLRPPPQGRGPRPMSPMPARARAPIAPPLAKGGSVREVAKEEAHDAVRRHVRYPAPDGHKGLGKRLNRG